MGNENRNDLHKKYLTISLQNKQKNKKNPEIVKKRNENQVLSQFKTYCSALRKSWQVIPLFAKKTEHIYFDINISESNLAFISANLQVIFIHKCILYNFFGTLCLGHGKGNCHEIPTVIYGCNFWGFSECK